jgi:hypothetical protein
MLCWRMIIDYGVGMQGFLEFQPRCMFALNFDDEFQSMIDTTDRYT